MSFFRFRLRQICDKNIGLLKTQQYYLIHKDFVLLQIVLQKTEIMNQGKTVFAQIMAHTKKLILQVHKDHKKAIV